MTENFKTTTVLMQDGRYHSETDLHWFPTDTGGFNLLDQRGTWGAAQQWQTRVVAVEHLPTGEVRTVTGYEHLAVVLPPMTHVVVIDGETHGPFTLEGAESMANLVNTSSDKSATVKTI